MGDSRDIKIALKYCGCCNPQVDLSRIARYLSEVIQGRGGLQLLPLAEENLDVVVILCGCPRSCGGKAEVKARAKRSLTVAGASVDGRPVPQAELLAAVGRELIKILDSCS